MTGNHDNKLTMNYYISKFNYIIYILLALFAFYINYHFSNIGLFPIDTFSFFDSGYLITQGYHPVKDFWIISGIFGDYTQALFFRDMHNGPSILGPVGYLVFIQLYPGTGMRTGTQVPGTIPRYNCIEVTNGTGTRVSDVPTNTIVQLYPGYHE